MGEPDLAELLTALGPAGNTSRNTYSSKLDSVLERGRGATRSAQDIGIPDTSQVNRRRKNRCKKSLRVFLETYFSEVFSLKWSEDHLRVLEKLERAIIHGELSAIAMSRGSGKTSISQRAGVWAVLSGHRNYVCIIAATETKAQRLLKSIKTELLHNEKLRQDFSAELHCLVSLGNRASMAGGQHSGGTLTGVEWNVGHINFGYVNHKERENTNNAMIKCMGITADIRGEQITLPDGGIRRPDLVLVDDPQTKSSAGSKSQVQKRHETLMGDVLGMAGPGKSIAGLCACTVVYAGDLADRLLDRDESPEWQGERCKLVYDWPNDLNKWDEYQTIYEEELRTEAGHKESKKFIKTNFNEMHAGSKVGWPERYDKAKELSALHHAFNLKIRDPGAFAAEYQNEPLEGFSELPFDLNCDLVSRRIVPGFYQNQTPDEVETITASIDVQKRLLYYSICGWTPSGRCYVIDYGTFPDQKRIYFAKKDAPVSLQDYAGTDNFEEALRLGLSELTSDILSREFSSGSMVDKLVIDARWGDSTEIIRRFCKESAFKSRIHPSLGVYIGANSRKWQKIRLGRRDKKGRHCKLQPPNSDKNARGVKELLIDTNFWKSFVASRLMLGINSPQAMVLFDAKPAFHRMFAEHLCAEIPKKVMSKTGDVVTEWDQPKASDNDWWDTLVYNSALASVLGVNTHSSDKPRKKTSPSPRKKTPRRKVSESVSANQITPKKESARDRMKRRRTK